MNHLQLLLLLALTAFPLAAEVYVDDFSGDLSNWTASPAHLDSYEIVDGELRLDGYGHIAGPSGWGMMQFDQPLGSHFRAEWDARLEYYDYINFTLYADAPWSFRQNGGSVLNGYLCWIDVDDPALPLIDLMYSVNGTAQALAPELNNIPYVEDIDLGEWIQCEVDFNHGRLRYTVGGVLVYEALHALYSEADYKIGLGFGEDSEGRIDNFQVTTFEPLPAVALSIEYDLGQETTFLHWTPAAGAADYLLYRSGQLAAETGLVLLGDTLSWSPGVLPMDAVRTYRVRALAP